MPFRKHAETTRAALRSPYAWSARNSPIANGFLSDAYRCSAGKTEVSQALPLAPVLVAAFLERQAAPDIEGAIAAIKAWSDYYFLADPCSSIPVRTVLERRLRIAPPRAFNKQDRELFAALPVEMRSVVYRREQERDNALRRLQQRAAEGVGVRIELRKFLARSNRITQKD